MAYEHGAIDMSYDEDGTPHQFKAVMLTVYKAPGQCLRASCWNLATAGRKRALSLAL